MALNGLNCAAVPLRIYSLTQWFSLSSDLYFLNGMFLTGVTAHNTHLCCLLVISSGLSGWCRPSFYSLIDVRQYVLMCHAVKKLLAHLLQPQFWCLWHCWIPLDRRCLLLFSKCPT